MKNFSSLGLSYLSQTDYTNEDNNKLLNWLKQYTETDATIYDEAMDAAFNLDKEGGNIHRLFDGSHDPFGAWDAVKNASDTDTFYQEVIGYGQAMFKDMSTPKGMPFKTLDQEWYNSSSDWITSTIGVSKDWYRDLITYDTFELFGSALGVVAALYLLKKGDTEKLSRILGSMGIISIMSANPIMGIAVIAITAYSYIVKKEKLDVKELAKGAAISGVACIVFSLVGIHVILELILFIFFMKILNGIVINQKEIQERLLTLSSQCKELSSLMIENISGYKSLHAEYELILLDGQKIIETDQSIIKSYKSLTEAAKHKEKKRERILEILKKMDIDE